MKSSPSAPLLLILYALFFCLPGFFTLPPIDRDESRFVQATKQMRESGDYVQIRFQEEARNKKPVGIYWAQAATSSLFGSPAEAPIWSYRIPSAIGILLAIVFTYIAGCALMSRMAALIGTAVFALALLLIAEGHIAATDGLMCGAIVATQAGLARVFARTRENPDAPTPWSDMALIWVGLGASALLKGPIGLMVAALTVLGVWLLGGGFKWIGRTRPWIGVPIALAIVLPWAVAITMHTGWAFWSDAVVGDLLSKAVSGKESHGQPPGYYLLLVTLTMMPGSLLLIPAVWRAVQQRLQPWAMFLIAWAVPTWLVFEAIPTKLPHYVLPLYPALALAIGAYVAARIQGEPDATPRWSRIVNIALWTIFVLALAYLPLFAAGTYGNGVGALDILLSLAVVGAGALFVVVVISDSWRLFVVTAAMLSFIVFAGLTERVIAHATDLHVSERLSAMVHEQGWQPGQPIASAGFQEPSLVFLTDTSIDLMNEGREAAIFLRDQPGAFVLVEKRKLDEFLKSLAEFQLPADRLDAVDGFNYSRGQRVTVALFRLRTPQ